MNRGTRIPVRIVRTTENTDRAPVLEQTEPAPTQGPVDVTSLQPEKQPIIERVEGGTSEPVQEATTEVKDQPQTEEWRDRALRLQAEMDNYRKRQRRLAQDEIEAERQRLLGSFLSIIDDLERALADPSADAKGLRQGVELTHRAALQLFQSQGVEPIDAEHQLFDPQWHEAVATTGPNGAKPNTVVHVVESGYRVGDQLLRPARVVVAV